MTSPVLKRPALTFTLFVVLVCGVASTAAAQQWNGPDANGNIWNANSGKVGIGVSSSLGTLLTVGRDLELSSWSDGATRWALVQGYDRSTSTIRPVLFEGSKFSFTSGNVGIGTTSPGVAIDVVNSVAAGTGTARFKNTNANTQVIIDTAASQNANLRFDKNASPFWYLGNDASNDRFRFLNSNSNGNVEVFTILQGGNVGIGTTNPTGSLEVQGAGQNNTVRVISTNAVSGGLYLQNTQTTGQAVVYTDNNRGSYAAYGGILTGGSANAFGSLFGLSRADQTFVFADGSSSQGLAVGTLTERPLILGTSNAEQVRIDSSGNVGIGKPDPQYKLDVVGDIKASGTIHAKYQDLAEWVPSSEELAAATVVVLDTTKSNQVISSTVSYDTRVAGVISAQPGITLGESGEGKVLVATTGRVRVKVDASRGPIQIGDLLVTSDVSGVAMKSEPVEFAGRKMHMPGTIIGKALEPLAKGSGEILVLLSLQ